MSISHFRSLEEWEASDRIVGESLQDSLEES